VLTTGWERTVQATGNAAKGIKRHINTQLIYPPEDGETILEMAQPAVMDEATFRQRILASV
jgi:NADH dehydrogenase